MVSACKIEIDQKIGSDEGEVEIETEKVRKDRKIERYRGRER